MVSNKHEHLEQSKYEAQRDGRSNSERACYERFGPARDS